MSDFDPSAHGDAVDDRDDCRHRGSAPVEIIRPKRSAGTDIDQHLRSCRELALSSLSDVCGKSRKIRAMEV